MGQGRPSKRGLSGAALLVLGALALWGTWESVVQGITTYSPNDNLGLMAAEYLLLHSIGPGLLLGAIWASGWGPGRPLRWSGRLIGAGLLLFVAIVVLFSEILWLGYFFDPSSEPGLSPTELLHILGAIGSGSLVSGAWLLAENHTGTDRKP